MWRNRLFYLLGGSLLGLGGLQLIPLLVALNTGDSASSGAFATGFVLSFLMGGGLYLGARGTKRTRTPALSVLLPILTTLAFSITAGMPFYFLHPNDGIFVALFEGVSFVTTTGASAYAAADQPMVFHLWRVIVSWAGGLLAICFALSFLTASNSGGIQLHRSPLPIGDSQTGYTRFSDSFKVIFPAYVLVTSFFMILFLLSGVPVFYAFGLAVSGVSTTAFPVIGSVLDIGVFTQLIMMVAMILGAMNWDVIHAVMNGRRANLLKDPESRIFLFVIVFGAIVLALHVAVTNGHFDIDGALFHILSATTGTGYRLASAEDAQIFNQVSVAIILLTVAGLGGAVISSTGGLKQLRILALLKLGRAELDRLAHPHGVRVLHIGKARLTSRDSDAVYLLVGGFVMSLIVGALMLGIEGLPFIDSIVLGFSALTLSGPLAEMIDPTVAGYTALTNADYAILTGLMLVGRIEATFLLAIMSRMFWKR